MNTLQANEFPFSAVEGQDNFKLALILAAINPLIGGVLVSGPRGSAKSTLARGLAAILPHDEQGLAPPFTTLPLGASEDRLLGTLDLQQVLQDKNVAFHPGLLSKAHGGVLYVDEVNLLADNLVDQLLDVVASGVNRIERDGISHEHPARFLLIGTMNPDEGELRPQLQDRFGLMVSLDNQYTLAERIQIVRLREDFDQDPHAFCHSVLAQQQQLQQRIASARQQLINIRCSDPLRLAIAQRCQQAQVDGVRADIVWLRAAIAHCAWRGADTVSLDDVQQVEELVLAHRRQAAPPSSPPNTPSNTPSNTPQGSPPTKEKNSERQSPSDHSNNGTRSSHSPANFKRPPQASRQQTSREQDVAPQETDWGAMNAQKQSVLTPTKCHVPASQSHATAMVNNRPSLAGKQQGQSPTGYQISRQENPNKADWFATLINSPQQWPPPKMHWQRAKTGQAMLHLILLDTSASTLGQAVLAKAKGAILTIAQQAYLKREQIAIFGFGNQEAQQLLPRVRAPKELQDFLQGIQAGGGTPIKQGLLKALSYLNQLQKQQPQLLSHTYVLTDGRTQADVSDIAFTSPCSVIDTENSQVKRGRAAAIAHSLGAHYYQLEA